MLFIIELCLLDVAARNFVAHRDLNLANLEPIKYLEVS